MLRYYIRFIVSAVLIYLIITQTSADVIGLLIGLSIVIINIGVNVVMSVMNKSDRSDKTEEETEQFVTPIKFQKIDPEDNSDEENEDDRK
jgi:Na+-transporting methylmalonyl-CoA/oxaloacetate decarboxylase beta subunit